MTPSGIEPATFRFAAQHLKHCATAKHVITYTDIPRNSMLDDTRGMWTSKLEKECVEGAPSMALVPVFSVY